MAPYKLDLELQDWKAGLPANTPEFTAPSDCASIADFINHEACNNPGNNPYFIIHNTPPEFVDEICWYREEYDIPRTKIFYNVQEQVLVAKKPQDNTLEALHVFIHRRAF